MYRSYEEQTLGYFDRPHTATPTGPVDGPAAWKAEELEDDDWQLPLTATERDALVRIGRAAVNGPGGLAALTFDDMALADRADLSTLIERCRHDLADGRGFVLVRDAPLDDLTGDETEAAFWALGLLLGTPGAQNGVGDLLGHVTDYHDDPDAPLQREYRSTVDINFHCDAADAVGLLCLAPALEGGESRLVSSPDIFNQLLVADPASAARLCAPAELDTRSDGEGFEHVPVQPVCFDGRQLRTFMHLGYFRSVARHADAEVDPALAAALDGWEAIAGRPGQCLDMELRAGDIQLCSNHTIAHARRGYVDDPATPRHLLRLWLTL